MWSSVHLPHGAFEMKGSALFRLFPEALKLSLRQPVGISLDLQFKLRQISTSVLTRTSLQQVPTGQRGGRRGARSTFPNPGCKFHDIVSLSPSPFSPLL